MSQRQHLPAGASRGSDRSSPGPDIISANPVAVPDLSPAGALPDLPQEAALKPKRRLKRSRSSPILAGRHLEQSQHDTGESEAESCCCLPCCGRQTGLQVSVVVPPAYQVEHEDLRDFAIIRLLCNLRLLLDGYLLQAVAALANGYLLGLSFLSCQATERLERCSNSPGQSVNVPAPVWLQALGLHMH